MRLADVNRRCFHVPVYLYNPSYCKEYSNIDFMLHMVQAKQHRTCICHLLAVNNSTNFVNDTRIVVG